jgi:hypothetical protein
VRGKGPISWVTTDAGLVFSLEPSLICSGLTWNYVSSGPSLSVVSWNKVEEDWGLAYSFVGLYRTVSF